MLLQDLALADPDSLLESWPNRASHGTGHRQPGGGAGYLRQHILLDLPVVDLNGVLLG